jgi:hypothetical protein
MQTPKSQKTVVLRDFCNNPEHLRFSNESRAASVRLFNDLEKNSSK